MSREGNQRLKHNQPSEVFISGIPEGAPAEELHHKIIEVFLKACDNLSWLSRGDKVLLKPALNSPYPYPATTHPQSILTVAEVLDDKGAKVIIADQSGVEHVLHDESGVIKGSSKENFEISGMRSGSNLQFTGFEEEGWEHGFYKHRSHKTPSWTDGFYLAELVQRVDHIINLPRLSTHAITGVTLGFKNMVGFLRDDSRLEFHANGPYNAMIKFFARKSNLSSRDDKSNKFFQKMIEISAALQQKLRVTLFTATKTQSTLGPDKYLLPIGNRGIGAAYEVTPDQGLVFASSDPIAAEVVALAFLTYLHPRVPRYRRLLHRIVLFFNGQVKELGKQDIWENPFVSYALELGLGNGAIRTHYEQTPLELQAKLNQLINSQ
jgi:uncharacterized protein (DUF362 family)